VIPIFAHKPTFQSPPIPYSALFNDMYNLPTPLFQAAADEPPMAAPGQPFGAEDGAPAPGGHSLQEVYPPEIIVGLHVGLVSSLAVSSQLLAEVEVSQPCSGQRLRQGFPLEMREFAGGKAAHIHNHLNPVCAQEVSQFLSRTIARSQGKDGFLRRHYFPPFAAEYAGLKNIKSDVPGAKNSGSFAVWAIFLGIGF
jgi:hypothetical protein